MIFSLEEKNKLYKLIKGIERYDGKRNSCKSLLDVFFYSNDILYIPFEFSKFMNFILDKGYISKFQYDKINDRYKKGSFSSFDCIAKEIDKKNVFDIWYINYLSEKARLNFDSFYKDTFDFYAFKFQSVRRDSKKFKDYVNDVEVNFEEDEENAFCPTYLISTKKSDLILEHFEILDELIDDEKILEILNSLKIIVLDKK